MVPAREIVAPPWYLLCRPLLLLLVVVVVVVVVAFVGALSIPDQRRLGRPLWLWSH